MNLAEPSFVRKKEKIKSTQPAYSYKGMCYCGAIVYEWLDGELFCSGCHKPKPKSNDPNEDPNPI